MLPGWHSPTRSWCRCANRRARATSQPTGSIAPSDISQAATHQQIYRTLRVMENDGWVHATTEAQNGRPDKKVCTVSERGRAELARLIAEPLNPRGPGRGSALSDNSTRDVAVQAARRRIPRCGGCARPRPRCAPNASTRWTPTAHSRSAHSPDPSVLRGAALHQYLVLRGGIRAEESAITGSTRSLTRSGRHHDFIPKPLIPVRHWVHHVTQPGGHGFDGRRTGRPGPPHRSGSPNTLPNAHSKASD
jgi:hypothetical protein